MIGFGKRLKLLRKREKYTLRQLSDLLGFVSNSYANFEYERIVPSIEKFVVLAEIYHTSVQYMITGKELTEEFQEDATPFPQRLRELRTRHGLTQKDVANALGVGEVMYQHYEYGDFEPKLDKLQKLAELFGVTLDELLGRNKK